MGILLRKVLVTGGLGFIGSNVALRLAAAGAEVTVVDSLVKGCGADPRNLAGAAAPIRVVECDIGAFQDFEPYDAVFNLAGEVSHIESLRNPLRDLELNAVAQLRFLENLRRACPGVRVVYAGTRQVYGVPDYLPVDEKHPVKPVDYNGVHKYAATMYHLLAAQKGWLDTCALRLTNVYGPRMALHVPGQGFLGAFFRRVLEGEDLEVFGDGRQLRDPVYVEDVVDAFLLAASAPTLPAREYNVGGPVALSLLRIAELMSPRPVRTRPFPAEHKAFDIGSYITDSRRMEADLGWKAKVGFEEGCQRTLDYFRTVGTQA